VTTSLEKEGSAPGAPSPGSCPLEGGQDSAYTAKCWPLYTQLGDRKTFLDVSGCFCNLLDSREERGRGWNVPEAWDCVTGTFFAWHRPWSCD